ncbi:MAG: hypothetical protein UV95_C0001G0178 [Candidatus Falkowbacteria bacterium GW2011_GWF2_43_32]|nr:MAG: hypothetical protein UV95_C0001G0178 [Candidatus Falkowbacteria bacterium GW2011_GWF2_43_32]
MKKTTIMEALKNGSRVLIDSSRAIYTAGGTLTLPFISKTAFDLGKKDFTFAHFQSFDFVNENDKKIITDLFRSRQRAAARIKRKKRKELGKFPELYN